MKFESTATMLEICDARLENVVRAMWKIVDEAIREDLQKSMEINHGG